jgi:hypothetical protein
MLRSQTPARSLRQALAALRCCLPPSVWRRLLLFSAFRGSISQPVHSLSMLRTLGRPSLRKTHFRPLPSFVGRVWFVASPAAYVLPRLLGSLPRWVAPQGFCLNFHFNFLLVMACLGAHGIAVSTSDCWTGISDWVILSGESTCHLIIRRTLYSTPCCWLPFWSFSGQDRFSASSAGETFRLYQGSKP